jgi:hypothetical protein
VLQINFQSEAVMQEGLMKFTAFFIAILGNLLRLSQELEGTG